MNNKGDRFAGAIGEDYDDTFRLICPHLDQLEGSVADALQPIFDKCQTGDRPLVLDLGCGDGLTAKPILDRYSSAFIYALDNEKQMLSQFEDNLSQDAKRFKIVCEDALDYLQSVETGYFDAIGSCFVIHNWPDEYRLKVLDEIYRVLKSGGIFVNADKVAEPRPRHDEVFLKQLTLVIDTYSKAKRLDLLREWTVHYLEDNIPGVLWFESEAIKQLESRGFLSVARTFRYDLEATLVATKPES